MSILGPPIFSFAAFGLVLITLPWAIEWVVDRIRKADREQVTRMVERERRRP